MGLNTIQLEHNMDLMEEKMFSLVQRFETSFNVITYL